MVKYKQNLISYFLRIYAISNIFRRKQFLERGLEGIDRRAWGREGLLNLLVGDIGWPSCLVHVICMSYISHRFRYSFEGVLQAVYGFMFYMSIFPVVSGIRSRVYCRQYTGLTESRLIVMTKSRACACSRTAPMYWRHSMSKTQNSTSISSFSSDSSFYCAWLVTWCSGGGSKFTEWCFYTSDHDSCWETIGLWVSHDCVCLISCLWKHIRVTPNIGYLVVTWRYLVKFFRS